jgi:hypothetical protein
VARTVSPKLTNEVRLGEIWCLSATLSDWGCVRCLRFGQFVIGRSAVQVRSSAPFFKLAGAVGEQNLILR